jgi:hypothetical protein
MGLGTIRAIPQEQFFKQPGVSPYAGRNFPLNLELQMQNINRLAKVA